MLKNQQCLIARIAEHRSKFVALNSLAMMKYQLNMKEILLTPESEHLTKFLGISSKLPCTSYRYSNWKSNTLKHHGYEILIWLWNFNNENIHTLDWLDDNSLDPGIKEKYVQSEQILQFNMSQSTNNTIQRYSQR